MQVPWEARTGVAGSCEAPDVGPLDEEYVCLTTEPPVQPTIARFQLKCIIELKRDLYLAASFQ